MINASFDAGRERSASICGAYQYDTGQRLRLMGLPSPEELAEMDDFLSGDVVTVQAQYSYKGDSQSEARLAIYDPDAGVWMADVPDVYLTRYAPVTVHVYVMYGTDEEHSRSKTCYEAVFTPISRPAPGSQVTPDQINAWDALVSEVNLSLAAVNMAGSSANAAATQAAEAAEDANRAAERAERSAANADAAAAQAEGEAAAAAKWGSAMAKAVTLAPGSDATVSVEEENDVKVITYGIPRGATGATGATGPQGPKGDKGDKGDTGPAGVTFSLSGTTLTITTV